MDTSCEPQLGFDSSRWARLNNHNHQHSKRERERERESIVTNNPTRFSICLHLPRTNLSHATQLSVQRSRSRSAELTCASTKSAMEMSPSPSTTSPPKHYRSGALDFVINIAISCGHDNQGLFAAAAWLLRRDGICLFICACVCGGGVNNWNLCQRRVAMMDCARKEENSGLGYG